MTMTVNGNFITYNDGTKQQSANFRVLDGNTAHNATNYAVGTYLLIDTKHYNSRTSPIPLDEWGRFYTGPTLMFSPVGSTGSGGVYPYVALWNNDVGHIQPVAASGASGGTVLSGTWVSRGSGLSQGFVVRIAQENKMENNPLSNVREVKRLEEGSDQRFQCIVDLTMNGLTEEVGYVADKDDVAETGQWVYAQIMSGDAGEIAEFVPAAPPTPEYLAEMARNQRDSLLRYLDTILTNPLRWAAYSAEQQAVIAKYRQDLLDIPAQEGFPTTIVWPVSPIPSSSTVG